MAKAQFKYFPKFGKITEDGLAEIRSWMGKQFQCYEQYNTEVTRDNIRHYAMLGLGDDNPLYLDPEYAAKTRWKGIIAPFSFPSSCMGRRGIPQGLPGVHNLWAGGELTCPAPLRLGTQIRCSSQITAFEEKKSQFAGRIFRQETTHTMRDQSGAVVAVYRHWAMRLERDESRERGKYKDITMAQVTDEDMKKINEMYEREKSLRRGAVPRYWEDVREGESLPVMVKGPYTVTDMIGWKMGNGWDQFMRMYRLKYEYAKKHPGVMYKNPQGVPDVIERVHWDDDMAHALGAPGAYDYGWQRFALVSHLLQDWVGDDGWIRRLGGEVRFFGVVGDTLYLKGKVTRKYAEGKDHLADLDVWVEDQRGRVIAPGYATVMLPSRTEGNGTSDHRE